MTAIESMKKAAAGAAKEMQRLRDITDAITDAMRNAQS